jgi:hypothetical protein
MLDTPPCPALPDREGPGEDLQFLSQAYKIVLFFHEMLKQ